MISPKRKEKFFEIYGFWGVIRLVQDVIRTRMFSRTARIIRKPFYVRGKRWIQIGQGFTSGPGLRMDAFPDASTSDTPMIIIGADVEVNDYVHIAAVRSVSIGNRVLIGSKVFITDHGHGSYKNLTENESPLIPPMQRPLEIAAVIIEDDVWIGENVSVLPGVTVGKGSIIGTGSVVTRNIPPYCIALGMPARVVKEWNFQTLKWVQK